MAQIGVELVGAKDCMSQLRAVAERAQSPETALRKCFPIFERAEAGLFDSYGGKYVETGATKRSLTNPNDKNAIRTVEGNTFIFGSSVWYAKFQGTTGDGDHSPPSAILKLTPAMAREASETVLDYVVHEAKP